MRIGIITFNRALNYGAVLQCFALQEYLKMQGHEVRVVDYRQKFIEKTYKPFSVRKLLDILIRLRFSRAVKYLKSYPARKSRQRKFNRFAERFLALTPACAASNIPQDFDLYIHGSDQIWSERLTGGLDKVYLGEYPAAAGAKKIAYAASLEQRPLKEREITLFDSLLANFHAVSVREKELIPMLQPFYRKDRIAVVVDPTILAPPTLWKPFLQNINSIPVQKYIALYRVGSGSLALQQAECIARQTGATIVNINDRAPEPAEFVSLIHAAHCVVSDSFHATVFSVLLRKDFYTAAAGTGRDVRLTNLLEALELQERLLHACTAYTPVDYTGIEARIERIRESSVAFLNRFLKDA